MEDYENLQFHCITDEDVAILTEMMTRAFDTDTRLFLGCDKGGPTGYDNGEYIRKWGVHSPTHSYKVILDDQVVGAVIVWINPNKVNRLGCLFVDPLLENRGIGLAIWQYIERRYPETMKWIAETPGYSKRNHHFYVNKCGFKIVKILSPMSREEECYVLEKEMRE